IDRRAALAPWSVQNCWSCCRACGKGTGMSSPQPSQDRFALSGMEFVGLMAALQALQALAIDIMLPALGTISHDLGASDPNERQLIVGVFLICAGFGSLVPGSLADRFGRKSVLVFSLCAYVVFSLA